MDKVLSGQSLCYTVVEIECTSSLSRHCNKLNFNSIINQCYDEKRFWKKTFYIFVNEGYQTIILL